jgi:DNA-binding beta-propeller fold protein YncE
LNAVGAKHLEHLGFIDLPEHVGAGGFDHAAVHGPRALLYVAHTSNDAVDVVDVRAGRYVRSVKDLKGVAGALVDEGRDLVFTSNRGEDTISIFAPGDESGATKIGVGARPNGLAFDPGHDVLLCANVGTSKSSGSHTVSLVDVKARKSLGETPVPGRTRWTVFDPGQGVFLVNIAEPARIAVIDPTAAEPLVRLLDVPASGPHGLDLDSSKSRLYCACDAGLLVRMDSRSGEVLGSLEVSGGPDVIFLNRALQHLYVAVGDPGVIDVIDVSSWLRLETIVTEPGAHTLAFDEGSNRVYAFLPETHRASLYQDRA